MCYWVIYFCKYYSAAFFQFDAAELSNPLQYESFREKAY